MNSNQIPFPGTRFILSSCEFEICWVGSDSFRYVAAKGGGHQQNFSFQAYENLLNDGSIEITHQPAPLAGDHISYSFLSSTQIKKYRSRVDLIKELVKSTPYPCSQTHINKFLATYPCKPGEILPKSSSIAELTSKWLKSGRRDESLLPVAKASKKGFSELDPAVEQLLLQSINTIYMHRQRKRAVDVHADLVKNIAEYNIANRTSLSVPSIATVNRRIRRIDRYQRDRARDGALAARRTHRAAGCSFFAEGRLDIVMCDGQVMDVEIVDDHGRLIGRPHITAAIDVRTRCIIGSYVSMAPFCGATLLHTLKEAVVAKEGYPRGVPVRLVVDNGADYRHKGFTSFCNLAGIIIEPCSPRTPNQKAIIERFFGTLNTQLIHKLPGTHFSNPAHRGDYETQRFASMTIHELKVLVDAWINGQYHNSLHSELGCQPLALWNKENTHE